MTRVHVLGIDLATPSFQVLRDGHGGEVLPLHIGFAAFAIISGNRCRGSTPPGSAGRGALRGQSPLRRLDRDQMRLYPSPLSSSNRLAKIGAVKLGSSSLRPR